MAESLEEQKSIEIVQLKENDWEVYRNLMMQACQDYPAIFRARDYARKGEDEKYWKSEIYGKEKNRRTRWAMIAKRGSVPVGVIAAYSRNEPNLSSNVCLCDFYVLPDMQGQGIGTRLFAAMMKELRGNKWIKKVELFASEPQDSAVHLYKEFGFEKTGDKAVTGEIEMSRGLKKHGH